MRAIPIIDLFAGPGGLGEGFSALRVGGKRIFRVALSIEMNAAAHSTLTLRSFYRQFSDGAVPAEYYSHLAGTTTRDELFDKFPNEAARAKREAWRTELGGEDTSISTVDARIGEALGSAREWVLIGGPPCQAYSLAGRSRNKGKENYKASDDNRHFLYREYLRIIARHWPSVFVLENVKGLLTSSINGHSMFDQILLDLQDPGESTGVRRRYPGYAVFSLTSPDSDEDELGEHEPEDYIVRCEEYGVPQSRHRVILFGVRLDLLHTRPQILNRSEPATVKQTIGGLPRLRSGLTTDDSSEIWRDCLLNWWTLRKFGDVSSHDRKLLRAIRKTVAHLHVPVAGRGGTWIPVTPDDSDMPRNLRRWLTDARLGGVANHFARSHMPADLYRYMYCACFAKQYRRSPNLRDFPSSLLPKHGNVSKALSGGFFQDRFRVQRSNRTATTITSHISKDGHYYIHYDPAQCRSLTVREAARLQTFPDNYFFSGNRTEQYVQVGNAVPPLLALQIADITRDYLA